MNDLENLKEITMQLQDAREKFTPIKERWYAWNYWARSQPWYGSWFTDCEIELADTLAFYPYETDLKYKEWEGYECLSGWKGAKKAIEDLENDFDIALQQCEESKSDDATTRTGHTYSRQEIADACNKTVGALSEALRSRSWYKPRKEEKGEIKC